MIPSPIRNGTEPWYVVIMAILLATGIFVGLFTFFNSRRTMPHDPDFCMNGLQQADWQYGRAQAHRDTAGVASALALAADTLERCSRDPARPAERRAGYAKRGRELRADAAIWRENAKRGAPFGGPLHEIPAY